jgi:ADP-heptose:LPS heptosyltransferase
MSSSNPSFYSKTRAARKVIVVDLGFLGDSIHLLPALNEIKRHYPQAELHTLSAPAGAEVLRLSPSVNRAWAYPLGTPSPPWWRNWRIISALRRERFDLAFNFSGADRTVFLTALTGAKWRMAHQNARHHFWQTWLIPEWVPRQDRHVPVFEQRCKVLAECGLTLELPRFDLNIPRPDALWAEEMLPMNSIHFSINASNLFKEWPLRHWIELAKNLLAVSPHVVIAATGSSQPREQERLAEFSKAVANSRLKTFGSECSISRLAALLQRCRVHVGADSGVMHLAFALDVPTIALYRDYPGTAEWLPRGTRHQHLLVACPCAEMKVPNCASKGEAACLAQISPDRVAKLLAPKGE